MYTHLVYNNYTSATIFHFNNSVLHKYQDANNQVVNVLRNYCLCYTVFVVYLVDIVLKLTNSVIYNIYIVNG